MKKALASSKALVLLLFGVFSFFFCAPTVFGQLIYSDFNSGTNNLSFVQDASVAAGRLRINNNYYSRAAVWHNTAQPVRNGFVTMFTFRILNPAVLPGLPPDYPPQNGADGFAFVIQGAGTGAIGNAGGQMGYGSDLDNDPVGISNSLAVEFDTYKNDALHDPDGNHISVHSLGQSPSQSDENVSSLGRVPSSALGINLKDTAEHTVRIEYDGTTMRIYVDNFNTPKLTVAVNFDNVLGASENAFLGFTGGTGAEKENHDILNWSYVPTIATPTAPNGTAPDADAPVTPAFSSVDYHPDSGAGDVVTTLRTDTSVLPDRATELWAKYYFPSNMSGGPYPLILMLAGNHNTCGYYPIGTSNFRFDDKKEYTTTGSCAAAGANYVVAPSHRGYDYLAEKMASRGYIVASINANLGINEGVPYVKSANPNFTQYLDDQSLILARGRLVLRHLQQLSQWNNGVKSLVSVNTYGATKRNLDAFVGMRVTVGSAPVRVRSVGRMYLNGNSRVHNLRIVRASDNSVVATASVSMSGGWTDRQFRYGTLAAPVTLEANTSYYIVSEEKKNMDYWYDSGSTVVANSEVTINNGIQSTNGTTWTNPGGQSVGPVDIIYEPLANRAFTSTLTTGAEKDDLTAKAGMKITTGAKSLKVLSLGRMALTGNNQAHPLSIVRVSDQVTVAAATVTMSGSTPGSYRYAALATPVTLAPNTQYYVVSQETSGGDKFLDLHNVTNPDGVGTVDGAVTNETGTTWNEVGTAGQTYGSLDFIYEDQVSSVPSSFGVDLRGKIDFANVGLMGHSRGGEGMRSAYELLRDAGSVWQERIMDSGALTNGIKAIFEFSPTDKFITNNSGTVQREVNATGTAWSVILPACDGDLFYLPGVKPFDRMSKLTAESPAKLKSTYYVYGTNHNAFNTQWHVTDSWGTTAPYPGGDGCAGSENTSIYSSFSIVSGHRIVPQQQAIGASAFLALMRGNVGNSASSDLNRNFDPTYDVPDSIRSLARIERGFLVSPDPSQTTKFNALAFPAGTTNLCGSGAGGAVSCSDVDTTKIEVQSGTIQPRTTPPVINHDENFTAATVIWRSPGARRYVQANSSAGASNVNAYQTLDFRVSRRRSTSDRMAVDALNAGDTTNFSIQLVMADGSVSAPVSLSKYTQLRGPVGVRDKVGSTVTIGELHPILKTVRIPLSDFAGANLSSVTGVRFSFADTKTGAIFLSGIVFSK